MDLLVLIQHAPVAGFIFLVTIITTLIDFAQNYAITPKFILNPYDVVHRKQWARVLTHGLVHANWLHLAFNMITFYYFSFILEDMIGHWQFGVLYVGCLVAGALPALLKHHDNPNYNALGASGAVSGVVLSFVMYRPTAQFGIFFVIPMKAWVFGLLFLGISYLLARRNLGGIAHDAHFSGAIAGLIITILLDPKVIGTFRLFLNI